MRPSQGYGGTGKYGHLFQGNKSLKLKGTGEQRQFWGIENIENQDFDFWEQWKMPIFFRETRAQVPHCGRASVI